MEHLWQRLLKGSSLLLLFSFLSLGCSSMRYSSSKAVAQNEVGFAVAEDSAKSSDSLKEGRLLIKKASLELIVDDLTETSQKITQLTLELGGYVNSSNAYEEKSVWLELKIPASQLETTIDKIATFGEEENRSVTATDVTEQVIDLEAKLTNNRALRDRLRKLLNQAKDVKDILSIEAELNRIQIEVDSMEGQLKRMRGDIKLSALTVKLERSRIYGPLGYVYHGVVWFFEKLFVIRD